MNLILCLLLLSSPLEEKKKITVVCPLDGHTFTATQILRTNDWGGVDLDFCRHAYKTRPMEFYVWVCPRCNFAGKKKDFTLPLTEEEKTALLGKLTPLKKIEKGMKQSAIPAHVKYDLVEGLFIWCGEFLLALKNPVLVDFHSHFLGTLAKKNVVFFTSGEVGESRGKLRVLYNAQVDLQSVAQSDARFCFSCCDDRIDFFGGEKVFHYFFRTL